MAMTLTKDVLVEMLKEKKLQEFNAELLKEEGALLDELALQRAARGVQ